MKRFECEILRSSLYQNSLRNTNKQIFLQTNILFANHGAQNEHNSYNIIFKHNVK